jgi:hypothetical protein
MADDTRASFWPSPWLFLYSHCLSATLFPSNSTKGSEKFSNVPKNAIKILHFQDIELLFYSNAIASSLTESITPNTNCR